MTFHPDQYVRVLNRLTKPKAQVLRKCKRRPNTWVVRLVETSDIVWVKERDLEVWKSDTE